MGFFNEYTSRMKWDRRLDRIAYVLAFLNYFLHFSFVIFTFHSSQTAIFLVVLFMKGNRECELDDLAFILTFAQLGIAVVLIADYLDKHFRTKKKLSKVSLIGWVTILSHWGMMVVITLYFIDAENDCKEGKA
eukprot:TRINITY_DN136096_c0_g1_i1.p2 TRINITY_DN136096_c0_g1~~TRINITY_DN136096_c0_g1_i1.p2  ORF type:complete len:133 (-),score=8.90 TRINITY_DN136096_c0_g1_i1:303-701(-)